MSPTPSFWQDPLPLVLASGSATRRGLLEKAGLPLIVDPAEIDERALEAEQPDTEGRAQRVARALALAKARAVSRRHPGHIVLGADQTLDHDGEILHKPESREAARRQLARMASSAHSLHSGFALMRDDTILAASVTSATLSMRSLSAAMLDTYLAMAGDAVLQSVGAYQIEGLGIHLFHAVQGDHTAILGLPLIDVLAVLRQHGAVL